MKHIFYCEWLRYRKLTTIFVFAYIAGLLFMHAKSPLYHMGELTFMLIIAVPSLLSLSLGFNQFLLYKKASHWTNLIHKPLPLFTIYKGMVSSFLLILSLVVILPVSIYLVILHIANPILIELRHYLIIPYVIFTALSFYFAAVFATLHPNKLAYCVVLLPFAMLVAETRGVAQFVSMFLVMCFLFLLSWATFKEDLKSNLRKPASAFSTNFAIQCGLFVILSFVVFESGRISTNLSNFYVSEHEDSNYYIHNYIMEDKERMLWSINKVEDEQFADLKNEVTLSTFSFYSPTALSTLPSPYRNQPIMDDRGGAFYDGTNKIKWSFSHQHMLYLGFTRSKRFLGYLGMNGRTDNLEAATPFTSVPIVQNGYIIFADKLTQYNEQTETFIIKLPVPSQQRLEYAPYFGSNFVAVVLTNEIQMFLKNQFIKTDKPVEPFAVIPVKQDIADLKNITFAELYDGHLVSVNYGSTQYNTFERNAADVINGYVVTYKTQYEGNNIQIAQRQYIQGWSDWQYYRDYLISHLHAFIKYRVIKGVNSQVPPTLQFLSIVIMLSVALFTFMLMRHSDKSKLEKSCWIVGSAITGIPGAITCWALSDWKAETPSKNSSI